MEVRRAKKLNQLCHTWDVLQNTEYRVPSVANLTHLVWTRAQEAVFFHIAPQMLRLSGKTRVLKTHGRKYLYFWG